MWVFFKFPGLVVACVGSFEWLLRLLSFRSKWQVRWCRLMSCCRVFYDFVRAVGAMIVETHAVSCGLCTNCCSRDRKSVVSSN